MNSRLIDIPVYERKTCEISSVVFNKVRLELIRRRHGFRITPEGLRSLDLILEDDAWIVVDRDQNDLPVMAWTDFHVKGRTNLHLPIKCTVLYYHMHAAKIEDKIIEYILR